MGCCRDGPPRSARCWGACTFVAFALAALWLLLGIWMTHLDERFTPVYTEITCRMGRAKVTGLRGGLTSGLSLGLQMNTTCSNPNPYTLNMKSPYGGRVYLGADRSEVAQLKNIPETALPAHGDGTITANVDISLNLGRLMGLLPVLFRSEIPVYMDQNVELVVDVNFLFGQWHTKRNFNKKCGFNMDGLGSALGDLITDQYEGSLGPMACAASYDALALPAVGDGSEEMQMFAMNVAPQDIEKAEKLKTTALSAAQGVFYALAGVFFLLSFFCAFKVFHARRQLAKPPREDSRSLRLEAPAPQAADEAEAKVEGNAIVAPEAAPSPQGRV